MRFSEAWLREWTNPQINTQTLADQLSMAGLEVDAIAPASPVFSGVVVGEVLSLEQHPNADKLNICQVNLGADEPVQIVCGAKNASAGMRVPVATVGACLPSGNKMGKAKLRGVQSFGMICSAAELGLADASDGIMALSENAPIGQDLRDYLQLDDQCIDVDLTPDRGDCLSMAGVAREVSAMNQSPLSILKCNPISPQTDVVCPVNLQAPAACPRYVCRTITNINAQAKTPDWMLERLRRGGVRGISPVVDVTNYVMLELGQPMHGFDLVNIQEGIQVRMATSGEVLTLLDGNQIKLTQDTLIIADSIKPLAIAGIMGGKLSGVSQTTTDILLEAAFFAPLAIVGKARTYNLHTESSHRFERGVDATLAHTAIERATALLLAIVGGQPGPVTEQASQADLPKQSAIRLRRQQISRILGIEIEDALVVSILTRLNMQVIEQAGGWSVTPPAARFDLHLEVDLIEELGRIYGYNQIPSNLSHASVNVLSQPEAHFHLDRAKQVLVDRDYQEAITYSFISPEIAQLIHPDASPVLLANPISEDMSVMRASLWPGLLKTLQYNLARQQNRIRLFESGLAFTQTTVLSQTSYLAAAICGSHSREQWGEKNRPVDFYDLKGDLEAVLKQLGDFNQFTFISSENSCLHPGQSARICRNDKPIGWIGMLHPSVQDQLNLPSTYVFEVELQGLVGGVLPVFKPLSRFPSIRRDLALSVPKTVTYQQVYEVIRAASPEIVRTIQLFDVYTGNQQATGMKSLALSLILQDFTHTLTDQEVRQAIEIVIGALTDQLAVKLREQSVIR